MDKIDLTDLNNWPEDAELLVDGAFFCKWVDGIEYNFFTSVGRWEKAGGQYNRLDYNSNRWDVVVKNRPDTWQEGEERMSNIAQNGNDGHYEELESGIDGTLKERGTRYGEFSDVANTTQLIKSIIGSGKNAAKMNGSQCEALDMIASKIARIVNGDPDYIDNWHDIAGYARLVEKELEQAK